ncbi:MAG TPA: DUF2336 domain-containing protein [Alphaproteobacteria bacterium]
MAPQDTIDIDIGFKPASLDEMLVDLHDAENRYKYADDKEMSLARQRIVQVVGDIAGANLTETERNLAADILLSLIRQAEKDLRASLSERLCVMDNAPESLILFLAHDVINVAKPILQYSQILTETDLLYIIQSKGSEYWQAIAQRKLLDTAVVDALVDKKDEGTAVNLLMNESIELKVSAIEVFAELCHYSDRLAEPLLARPELPRRLAMDLFWHVSQELRSQIVDRFEIPKETLDAALQDALADFSDTVVNNQTTKPSALMVDLARQYKRLNKLNDAILITTLRRGQTRFFVALFAERTGLDHSTVFELMRQAGGQGMAVACRAMNISKESFLSLFLLSRSLTQTDHAVDALELRKAIRYYDALTEVMATRIMASSIHRA